MVPFRWGVGRLVMESKIPPLIACFYHTGLDKVMPETCRTRIPRLGEQITCRFGKVWDSQSLLVQSSHMSIENQRAFITQRIFEETDRLRLETLRELNKKV